MDPVLKVRDVCLSYHTLSGETPALSHISFDLMPGEFLSIGRTFRLRKIHPS